MKKLIVEQLCVLLLILMVQPALAENHEELERAWDFGIGIGFGEQSNPFVGADDVPGYLTLDLAIYGERFFFDNGDFGFTFVDRPEFGLNLISNFSSERIYYSYFNDLGVLRTGLGESEPALSYSIIPASELAAFSTNPGDDFSLLQFSGKKFALNLGIELLVDTDFGQMQWQISQDISGEHSGTQLSIDLTRSWVNGRWAVKPNLGVSWKSKKLIDYYYGFENPSDAFQFSYNGRDTTNFHLGLVLSYQINNHLSYVNHFKYTHLGSGIDDSPLTVTNSLRSFFSGLYYRF